MIPVMTYLLVCTVVATVLTIAWTVTRPIKTRDEVNSGRAFMVFLALAHAGPFAFVEVLTKKVGADVKDAVVDGYRQAPVDGPMDYFRVVWTRGDRARALVVGTEVEEWGGTDRPVVWLNLERAGAEWKTSSYEIAYSSRLNRESVVFPPYR